MLEKIDKYSFEDLNNMSESELIDILENLHENKQKDIIDYTDSIYLDFGADTRLEGTENKDEIDQIKKN